MRISAIIIIMLLATSSAAWADNPPSQAGIPLTLPYRHIAGDASPLQETPHFFPLPARRPAGRFIVSRARTAPLTSAVEGPPQGPLKEPQEAMTQEQASQILSLFGGSE